MKARQRDRTTRRKFLLRQEMIEAGLLLLKNTTFGSLNIEAVAERAEVSKATLYNHFGSRGAFLDAVVSHQLFPQIENVQAVIRKATSVESALSSTMQTLVECLASLASACGPEGLMKPSVHRHLEETVRCLGARLADFHIVAPDHLSTMTCVWAYGMAVTENQTPTNHSQASDATSLLLAGYREIQNHIAEQSCSEE
jgi:AcrR family transcriptional regulator